MIDYRVISVQAVKKGLDHVSKREDLISMNNISFYYSD